MGTEPRGYAKSITERVQAGVELLDQQLSGWDQKIDLEVLDLGNCAVCVLGRLYGDYLEGVCRLDLFTDEAAAYGFDGVIVDGWEDGVGAYSQLTEEWRYQITGRRRLYDNPV